MDCELAGVAAGVGADLALEGPLVVVDTQVFLQAAAVRRRVRTVRALVRLLPRVRAAVHVELVPPAEALVAELALKRLLPWTHITRRSQQCCSHNSTSERNLHLGQRERDIPVWVLRCRSISFWPYCVLKVQPVDEMGGLRACSRRIHHSSNSTQVTQ